jgi:hypothetical protein
MVTKSRTKMNIIFEEKKANVRKPPGHPYLSLVSVVALVFFTGLMLTLNGLNLRTY